MGLTKEEAATMQKDDDKRGQTWKRKEVDADTSRMSLGEQLLFLTKQSQEKARIARDKADRERANGLAVSIESLMRSAANQEKDEMFYQVDACDADLADRIVQHFLDRGVSAEKDEQGNIHFSWKTPGKVYHMEAVTP